MRLHWPWYQITYSNKKVLNKVFKTMLNVITWDETLKGPQNAQLFCTNICANFQYCPHTRTNIFAQIFGLWYILIRVKTILKVCAQNCAIVTPDLNWNSANSQFSSKVMTGYDDMRLLVGGRNAKFILKSSLDVIFILLQ